MLPSEGRSDSPTVTGHPTVTPTLTESPTRTESPTVTWQPTGSPTLTLDPTQTEIPTFARDLSDEERKQERDAKRLDLENNNSMVFMAISTVHKDVILSKLQEKEYFSGKTMKMVLDEVGRTPNARICGVRDEIIDDEDNEDNVEDIDLSGPFTRPVSPKVPPKNPTRYPTNWPTRYPPYIPARDRDDYANNAPGSFTIFKFVLFGLLIASPCLRAIHLWYAHGGRIRFRRSGDENNRVVGLQYIPPMENWFVGGNDVTEGERPIHRLTEEQVMSLPEIFYRKPVFHDDIAPDVKKTGAMKPIKEIEDSENSHISKTIDEIFRNSLTLKNISNTNSSILYNEDEDRSANGSASTSRENTPIALTGTLGDSAYTISDGQAFERAGETEGESVVSEQPFAASALHLRQLPTSPERVYSMEGQPLYETGGGETESNTSEHSFENEPSPSGPAPIHLRTLPTSPERVPSTFTLTTQGLSTDDEIEIDEDDNCEPPMSPRAIIVRQELPPDEEQPEEHQHPILLQPPQPQQVSPQQQQQQQGQQQRLVPMTPATQESLDSTALSDTTALSQDEDPGLSFRTQRRLGNFTTTTCTSCSICLDDYEVGEKLRLLPKCGHAFHTECILPWLKDRQGCCPICKKGVLQDGATTTTTDTTTSTTTTTNNDSTNATQNAAAFDMALFS